MERHNNKYVYIVAEKIADVQALLQSVAIGNLPETNGVPGKL